MSGTLKVISNKLLGTTPVLDKKLGAESINQAEAKKTLLKLQEIGKNNENCAKILENWKEITEYSAQVTKERTSEQEKTKQAKEKINQAYWQNPLMTKGVVGTKVASKSTQGEDAFTTVKINKETQTVVEDSPTTTTGKDLTVEEDLLDVELKEFVTVINVEEYTLGKQFLTDFNRNSAFVVENSTIDPTSPHALSQFLNACKSELGLDTNGIKNLSRELQQSLLGSDLPRNFINNLPPKGAAKSMKEGNAVLTLSKSDQDNVIDIQFKKKGPLKMPYDIPDGHTLDFAVNVACNTLDGTFTRTGAYAKIVPPLPKETINTIEKEAAKENTTLNNLYINESLDSLKINDLTTLNKNQREMIEGALSLNYSKELGKNWPQLLLDGDKLKFAVTQIFEKLKTNSFFQGM
jgi:hypothetical protein